MNLYKKTEHVKENYDSKQLLCSLEHFLAAVLRWSAVWVADNILKVGAGRG